jgi:hypothetical protein
MVRWYVVKIVIVKNNGFIYNVLIKNHHLKKIIRGIVEIVKNFFKNIKNQIQ